MKAIGWMLRQGPAERSPYIWVRSLSSKYGLPWRAYWNKTNANDDKRMHPTVIEVQE